MGVSEHIPVGIPDFVDATCGESLSYERAPLLRKEGRDASRDLLGLRFLVCISSQDFLNGGLDDPGFYHLVVDKDLILHQLVADGGFPLRFYISAHDR